MVSILKSGKRLLIVLVLCLSLCGQALATGAAADGLSLSVYSGQSAPLSLDELKNTVSGEGELVGIVVSGTPAERVGTLYYGDRELSCGDAVPAEFYNELRFVSASGEDASACFEFFPVFSVSGIGSRVSMDIDVLSGKNSAPTAGDVEIETYKNIAITGSLAGADEDGDELLYTITSEPKRGTVELTEGNGFVYTPKKNKVGKDSFTYTVSDSAGNVSEEATVSIQIKKPETKLTYSDMVNDPSHYAAIRLIEEDIFVGEQIAGAYYFSPDKEVTRGEFLVMTMKMLGIPADEALSTTGFADDEETPGWVKPYLSAALRAGIVSGVSTSGGGLVFRSDTSLTRAEAAVMLSNALGVSESLEVSDVRDDAVPAWAAEATANLVDYGILEMDTSGSYRASDTVTRAGAAELLSDALKVLEEREDEGGGLLSWAR